VIDWTPDRKLTAALHEHKSQVDLLRHQTGLDLRIFGGYISLQLAVGSWIATHPIPNLKARLGMGAIDLALCALAAVILWRNSVRRGQVVAIVRRLNEALGYTQPDVYLKGRALHENHPFVPWFPYYLVGIGVGLLGVTLVLFQNAFAI
jgi:hypothetical protein